MDAIILAGGLGTRLAQTVPNRPKALAPILNIPFLEILLRQLERCGLISTLVMALGYRATDILSYLQNRKSPLPIKHSIETEPLGTGGALLKALDDTSSETLLVMNGDSFFDISLGAFHHFHAGKKADLSIACREVEDASRYGILEVDTSLRISMFREKSTMAQKGLISTGIYLIERSALLQFPKGSSSLEKEIFPTLLTHKLFAYFHSGTFIDIGTDISYRKAQETLQPWTVS